MDLSETAKLGKENIKEMDITQLREVKRARWQAKFTAIIIEYVLLFLFWVLLSGRYQLKYLLIGAGACALVTYLTHDLLYRPNSSKKIPLGASFTLSCALRLIAYIPWLVWAIIKANIQVAMIIIKPQMPIDPGFLQFKTKLTRKIALVTLANSITLTPGTITVDLQGDTYIIHAIVRGAASDLESGLMQNKAGAIFCDCKDSAPACSWAHSSKELEK
jgi:multicomponent Na+:H+ antiporter subunit E